MNRSMHILLQDAAWVRNLLKNPPNNHAALEHYLRHYKGKTIKEKLMNYHKDLIETAKLARKTKKKVQVRVRYPYGKAWRRYLRRHRK